ncbi:MAG: RNA polymerase sigma factor [Spirochaetales bacterium]|nr:RNA polymerase sigma factor [Spirochaetales bacterium]
MNKNTGDDALDFIDNYSQFVYSVAFRLTADRERSEDLSQKTMIKAWENRGKLKNINAMKSWLKRICLNEFLMEERKRALPEYTLGELNLPVEIGEEDFFVDHSPSVEEEFFADRAVREIREGCFFTMASRLPVGQRISFSLIDMFGLKPAEVSPILNVSEGAVKGLLHRARETLFLFFSQKCEWVDPRGMCRCSSWKAFVHDREELKKEVVRRSSQGQNGSPPISLSEVHKEKILTIYRTIPDRRPPSSWYESVIQALSPLP